MGTTHRYIKNSPGYQDVTLFDNGENQDVNEADWRSQLLQDFYFEFFVNFATKYQNDPRIACLQVVTMANVVRLELRF